jgi:serine/threonine protein kinase
MPLSARRWKQLTESRYAHEREALEFLRDALPDRDPIFVYSNFEFIADDGTVNEIDTLIVTQAGVFLVELKSRGGIVAGNRHIWDWTKDGHTITVDSPLTLANSKARKLAGLLSRQHAFRGDKAPWIEALVFLSAPGISVRLPDSERMRICEREPRDKKPGIIPAMLQREYYGNESARGPYLDLGSARRVAKALDDAGIRPSPRQRRVGDYVLKELIEENPLFAYQDFQAEHPTTKANRRVRLYTVAGKDKSAHESVRRAALQEFQILESLDHPGILRALDFSEHELGPAILFRRDPAEVRLDHFLRQREATLTLDVRLDLVRQIAEAVGYAHRHRVVHRTLSPKSILVINPDSERPEVRLFNWQAGRVLATGSTPASPASRTSTLHPSQYSEESTLCYLAPESVLDPRGRDPMADIFSMGAVAFHVFSGRPPAATGTELNQILTEHKGLPLGAVLDGAAAGLQTLVYEATSPDLLLRTENVRDFLDNLDRAEEKLTAPPEDKLANPLEAKPGDLLHHNLTVVKRLGGGTSAVALLVQRGEEVLVLKYAREPKDSERIEKEHQIMMGLRDELIVSTKELLDFPTGNKGFLMEYAGEWDKKREANEPRDTLARELKAVGRLSLDFLGRFGEDLLRVVQYLEDKGVAHRDLKPDNIGIKEYAKKLHLKVFDFSLSSAPLDNVRVGTPPYLEPFLQLRKRWDTAAERYSAAVILYEMATGTTPRWGDGQSAPHLIEAEVTIDAELIDSPVRQDLNDFFRRCFQRDPRNRFDNAAEMLLAWQNIFHKSSISESHVPDVEAQEKALTTLRPDTLLSQLGVSTRAQNILDRLSILTAQELAAQSPNKFSKLRGVGHKTRREIMDLVGKLRSRLPQTAIPERSAVDTAPEITGTEPALPLDVDALTSLLIPVESSASGKVGRQIMAQFLELDDHSAKDILQPPQYPSQSQLADRTGKSRAQIGQVITKARERWRRTPQITLVRTEIANWIAAEGGLAHIGELAQFLLSSRGSSAHASLALRRAAAVLRAALEAEKPSESCRFSERRRGDRFLVALVAAPETPFGEPALEYADKLAEAGRTLAFTDPLPSPARVLETLRQIPATIPALRDDRLVRLAAADPGVAVSPRLELYPRHLDALRALKLAQSSLAGITELSVEDLRSRVRDRYPEAQPLPNPPELHNLVEQAGLGLKPDRNGTRYVAPTIIGLESTTSLHRVETIVTSNPASYLAPFERPRELEEAFEFERRLQMAYRSPSYLVLATEPKLKALENVRRNLAKHFPMDNYHCEREFISALRREAESRNIRWEVLLRADAAKPESSSAASRDWENLKKLAAKAANRVADQLRSRNSPTLILYPGILARYGQLSILDELADSLGEHSLWLLAGSDRQAASPLVDGQAIPARPTQWAWIPTKWIENGFRNYKGGSAA